MEHYGKTIRKLRLARNVSQQTLCQAIMSRSNLSRFENEEYIPGFDKVIQLLKRLNVEVDEFIYINNNYRVDSYEQLYRQLIYAENRRNKQELLQVSQNICGEKENGTNFFELYLLSQLALLEHHLPAHETLTSITTVMKPVLFQTEDWLFADFRRLNNFLRIFEIEEAVFLYQRATKAFKKYEYFTRENNVVIHLGLNLGQLLLEDGDARQAVFYFEEAKAYAENSNKLFQKLTIEASLEKVLKSSNNSHSLGSFAELLTVLEKMGYTDTAVALKNYVE
ncbi:helix-turn-helix domain-containing protein [Enterococcus sp. LJL51]|uniref:helix-turn-helix domain-containing protein n=1 Tax=Enterococcus sp. LJL51 TaxID=3416656 RepID=UPI003CF4811C